MPAPLCRFCGTPIRKLTETHWIRSKPPEGIDTREYTIGEFRSKAELQKVTNHRVVSVSYYEDTEYYRGYGKAGLIWKYSTWDGETYVDPYFCTGDHAKRFAYACCDNGGKGYGMPAYTDALKRQEK